LIDLFLTAIWYTGGDTKFDEVSHAQEQTGLDLESQNIDVGEVTLHVVFAGPVDGEPVILMHGFPQFWYMWRHHIVALANAGYRVAAPDMRGYNRSEKPAGKTAYEFKDLADDVIGLMNTQGWQSANIVAHDIGARVAWDLVFNSPERILRAVIVSVGHQFAFDTSTADSGVSWYRTFLKLPFLPALFSRVGGLSVLSDTLRDTEPKGAISEQDIEIYESAWAREHAFDTMIGVYTDFDTPVKNIPENGHPAMPVLFLYGLGDKFISNDVAQRTRNYLGEANVKLYPNLTHWLLEEDPEMTSTEILGFLSQPL